MALTQACIEIHNASSIKDIEHLLEMPELFEKNGYTFPSWITSWMKMLADDPLLNAEEHFNRPQYISDVFTDLGMKFPNWQNNADILRATTAINTICSDHYSPKRYALFAIATEILFGKNEFSELAHEWHCNSNEWYSLSHQPNYFLFLSILNREIAFWQDIGRNRISPPLVLKLNPSFNSI